MVDNEHDEKYTPRGSMETVRGPLPEFVFPPHSHLLITTHSAIYSKDCSSIRPIFRSSNDGIVSAKEASNGTGLLAVADGYVVVLRHHNGDATHRHKLKAVDGTLGLLAFANRDTDLIFSTALQTSLRCFSIEQDRVLDFHCTHPSPPTALAVSSNSVYVISASASPPVVYLQDLKVPGLKVNFKPKQSHSPVTVAEFHPERNEIFLLGYSDGTISVHTASRIVLLRAAGSDGCLGHLKRAHRLTNTHSKRRERRHHGHRRSSNESVNVGDRSVGVTAAAFVSGYNLRTVSVAGDGRCRVVEFDKGANLIRCWSVQAACSSLAVYTYMRGAVHSEPNYIIAIGRVDGVLLIFDAAGLLRSIEQITHRHRPLLDLAWIPEQRVCHVEPPEPAERNESRPRVKMDWSFTRMQLPTSSLKLASPVVGDAASFEGLEDEWRRSNTGQAHMQQENKTHTPSAELSKQEVESSTPSPLRLLDYLKQNRFQTSKVQAAYSTGISTFACIDEPVATELLEANRSLASPDSPRDASSRDTPNEATIDFHTPSRNFRRNRKNRKRHSMPCSWIEGSSGDESSSGPDSPESRLILSDRAGSTIESRQQAPVLPFTGPATVKELPRLRRASELPTVTMLANEALKVARECFVSEDGGNAADIENLSSSGSPVEGAKSSASPKSASTRLSAREAPQCKTVCEQYDPNAGQTDSIQVGMIVSGSPAVGVADVRSSSPLYDFSTHQGDQAGFASSCDYTCADVIREELTLVRAEIAALRKGLWVFGSRIDGNASRWIKEWETADKAARSIKLGEAPTY